MSEKYYFLDQPHQLKEKIERTLARHPELAQAAIQVHVEQKKILLQGQVQSYYHKQVAQESLKKILPEFRIQNEMSVVTVT